MSLSHFPPWNFPRAFRVWTDSPASSFLPPATSLGGGPLELRGPLLTFSEWQQARIPEITKHCYFLSSSTFFWSRIAMSQRTFGPVGRIWIGAWHVGSDLLTLAHKPPAVCRLRTLCPKPLRSCVSPAQLSCGEQLQRLSWLHNYVNYFASGSLVSFSFPENSSQLTKYLQFISDTSDLHHIKNFPKQASHSFHFKSNEWISAETFCLWLITTVKVRFNLPHVPLKDQNCLDSNSDVWKNKQYLTLAPSMRYSCFFRKSLWTLGDRGRQKYL